MDVLLVSEAVLFFSFHGRSVRAALTLMLGMGAMTAAAHALERVNLRNGFSYDCARQERLDAAHVRLYLPEEAASGARNYIDLPIDAIDSVEFVPEPPPAQRAGNAHASQTVDKTPGVSTPDVHTLLAHAGTLHNVDVDLLASIVHAESGGYAAAVSRAGALGLMQLMPGTAQAMGVANALRAEDNIAGGTAYLDALLTRYHDNLALALAAYNAGPAAVDRYHGIPPFHETRTYVARVMTEFRRRKLALERTTRGSR